MMRWRSTLVFTFDLVAGCAAWVGAYLLRFNLEWDVRYAEQVALGLAILLPAHVLACRWAGLYRGMWVFASLPDLKRVLKSVCVSSLALLIWMALYRGELSVPRSMVALYPLLLITVMAGGRVAYRMWKEHRLYGGLIAQGKPVVIVGAGRGGAMLVRELERSPDWRVVGLLDDDPAKWGLELQGHPVFGPVQILPEVLKAETVRHVILAMPSAAREARRRAAGVAIDAGAQIFTVPGLEDVMSGRVAVSALRPVRIEDLLGRDMVRIDTEHVRAMLAGKTVLITGAGGSIGSELCRQVVAFSPGRVLLVEQSEFALYTVEQWFSSNRSDLEIVPLIADVKDEARIGEIFSLWRPEIVFHAAAYKHVPLMEVENAWQAVRNNVFGTLNVAECARRFDAQRFVLISTDKAVNPTNVMGATKRLAEMACEALQVGTARTVYQIVRFGNVLGSAGSVIPKFQQQIARGGPVTVTHREITRYFMSIPEAALLVLQAATMGKGKEIFVLDMGEPVKIVDLARNMIRLSGYTEDEIRIEFSGLRPGEKLYEELLADAEQTLETPHPKLRIARPRSVDKDFLTRLELWLGRSGSVSDDEVRRELAGWVPEYTAAPDRTLRVVGGADKKTSSASIQA